MGDRSGGGAWVARHGLRTLVKRGDRDALAALGVRPDADVSLHNLTVNTDRVLIDEAVTVTFTLELASGPPADVVIDYRVHYVSARAIKAPKVFKLAVRRLEPARPATLTLTHRFDHVSIRRIRPGPHTIDVQVSGVTLGSVTVDVDAGQPAH